MNSSSFLLKCFAEGNQDAVLKSVNCLNEKQLCNLIDGHHPQTCELMQVILKALITDKNEGFQKHDFVVKHCVSLINEGQMPQKVLAGMVSYLLVQINSASCSLLLDLCNIFLEAIESGICRNEKSLELFAKVLSAISLKESVFHKKDICTAMSGPQYKAYILNKLCSSRWHASCIVSMASMFRGIDMSEEELRVVVEKMILTLPSIDILELPPLVYQLLLMSNQGFKRTILAGIISYMTSLNLQIRKEQEASNEIVAISDKQLQPLEGTVILHMTYAIKQDQDLGKELIKYFKENSNTSSSFRLALSLAVARISRFHDLIFDILKSSIIKAYKDNERFNSCRWLRDSSRTPLTIEKATLKVIENSSLGWDQVTQGMLELGFILVDGFLVKIQPAQLQVSRLGTTIILKCFKVHDAMREEILEQIINRIISKGIATVTNYIDMLAYALKIINQLSSNIFSKLKRAINHISLLPFETSREILLALLPQFVSNFNLRDHTLNMLFKAVFSRSIEARKIAAFGMTVLLKAYKEMEREGNLNLSSQVAVLYSQESNLVHIHSQTGSKLNHKWVKSEILRHLQRCLSHQASVKEILYKGFYQTVSIATELQKLVYNILMKQFSKVYRSDSGLLPPLALHSCLITVNDETFIVEPLPTLVYYLYQLHFLKDPVNDLPASNLISSLNSVVTRMIKCEIEDFQLDKEADFSPVTAAGCRNLILCKLIANLYEVLIEFMLRKNDFAIGDCEDATRLFERYSRITQILRENGNNPHVRSVKSKYKLETMISFSCVSTLIRIIFGNVSPCYQESQRILSQSISFVKFTFIALQDRLNEVGSCSADHMEIFQYCQTVGRTIFKSIIGETVHETFLTTDDGIMNKSISLLQLETFGSLINTIFKSFSDRIEPFLRNLSILDEQINNQDEMIYALVAFFQKLINSALTAGAEFKQAHIAMTIILSLLQHLGESGLKQIQKHYEWLLAICKHQVIDDLQLVKCFIDQLFTICNRIEDILGLLLTVSIDIHGQLGDVEEDIEVKKHNNFAIITEFTAAPTVLVILSSQLEAAMENIDWLVSNLNALIFDDDIGEAEFSRTYSEMEATVCSRLTMVAQCLQEIIESAIPTKTCTECSVKGVTRLYTSMTFLVKHYMQLFMRRRVTVSERFENLVKLSGLQVTPKVYAMLTYLQANRAIIEDTDDNRIRKKRKGKSNSSSTTRGNAVRESRVIPNLIYAIEMYEAHLIRLEAKLQVNLMQYFKRSTSRDFKIHGATLQTIIDDDSDDSYEVPMEVSEKNRPRKKLK